jgi:hypothetical protein
MPKNTVLEILEEKVKIKFHFIIKTKNARFI